MPYPVQTIGTIPILDYHNHLCVVDLFHDRTYATITEMWIATDPYKHRAMRILGVPEQKITQSQSAYETLLCEITYAICYGNAKRMLCKSGGFQSYNP